MQQDAQIDALIALYTRGQYAEMVAQAKLLCQESPSSYMLWTLLAAAQKALGHLAEAEIGFRKVTELNPTHAEGYYNLGITLHDQGKYEAAVLAYQSACALQPNHAVAFYNMGNSLREMGALEKAVSSYRRATEIDPGYGEAYGNLGNTLRQAGDLVGAIAAYEQAIRSKPSYAEGYRNYAIALAELGRNDEAVSSYFAALQINHADADAYKGLGNLFCAQLRFGDAILAYSRALELNQTDCDVCIALGHAFQQNQEIDKAILAYRKAIEIKPASANAYNNLGAALIERGDMNAAIEALDVSILLNPTLAEAYNNQGNAFNKQGKFLDAIASYERSLALDPDNSDTFNNLGTALHSIGRFDDEITAYRRAIEIDPDNASAHNNLAGVMLEIGAHDQAIASYQKALEINPQFATAEAQLLHQQQHVCDFKAAAALEAASARFGIQTEPIPPFPSLGWSDNPEHQFLRAKKWAQTQLVLAPAPHSIRPANKTGKLRVGFFTADIRPHPMMYCLSGLLGHYDRASTEIIVFHLNRGPSGEWPQKVKDQVDLFIHAETMSDQDLIHCARAQALDVLIDLSGYTAGNRCSVVQARLAPVQVNFLGFPGTMGAEFIDYIIADPIVIPDQERAFYSEKIIYLPHSYFPIDYSKVETADPTNRADHGLPERGVVFCCFNNAYKIGPREFAIWMRLLAQVDGSVLWLLKANAWARDNLIKEAALANIDPSRLIFADKVSIERHLERHRHADLFLDTFNYNAHTTACDALWTGVPLVTKIGRQFSARVAASLLTAAGLPELITASETDYERTSLRLAQSPDILLSLKRKLLQNKDTCPLFDSRRYARNFGTGLATVFQRALEGRQREDIFILDDKSGQAKSL